MAIAKLTESEIRLFLQDKKELNPLLRGIRFSAEDIDSAINRCVDFYNESAPFTDTLTPSSFPYRYSLLMGVSGYLLKSASINEAGNELSYSADGISIQDKDKAEIFAKLGAQFWDEFKDKITNIKVCKNLGQAFGSDSSELMYMAQ